VIFYSDFLFMSPRFASKSDFALKVSSTTERLS